MIIIGEGGKDRQANNMQHKAYMEDANNNRTVPHRADCEKHNLYMACMKVNTYHSDDQEDEMPNQENRRTGADMDMTDVRQNHDNRYKAPKTKVMQSKQKGRSCIIRTRSGCISHKS